MNTIPDSITPEQAIQKLATYGQDNHPAELIEILLGAVDALCKTATVGDTDLRDWLDGGIYTGSETPELLAEEWDDLSNE